MKFNTDFHILELRDRGVNILSKVSNTIFKRELNALMKIKKHENNSFDVLNMPLNLSNPDSKVYGLVGGITDVGFTDLNGKTVEILDAKEVNRARYDKDGNVKRYEKFVVPSSNVLVALDGTINLKLEHQKMSEKCKYVDYTDVDLRGTPIRKTCYSVPKDNVYEYNRVALVLSRNRRTEHLGGEKILLKNGHTVYIYILPFSNRKFTSGYKILAVKSDVNFKKELIQLKSYWKQQGLMFKNTDFFTLTDDYGNSYNLVSEVYGSDTTIPRLNNVTLSRKSNEEEE